MQIFSSHLISSQHLFQEGQNKCGSMSSPSQSLTFPHNQYLKYAAIFSLGVITGSAIKKAAQFICLQQKKSCCSSRSKHDSKVNNPIYENSTMLNEYMLMHYGGVENNVTDSVISASPAVKALFPYAAIDFPLHCAESTIKYFKQHFPGASSGQNNSYRVLDVGCAVGRSTFELAQYFSRSVGLDYSASFIEAANFIKNQGKIDYSVKEEGEIFKQTSYSLAGNLAAVKERVEFYRGDACALDIKGLGKFHCVMAANLLCRLPEPQSFLDSLVELVEENGIVVFFSPYTWLEEFTNKNNWLGAREDRFSQQVLAERMGKLGFEHLLVDNLPFLIRETRRKYQFTVSNVLVFQLRK
jgi:putative 4-mercaptohistidine N1-methyltranferase